MSMWRLLTVLVTLAVPLVVATLPESGLVAIAAQQVTTIMPHDLQPVPNPQLPTAERLAQLHKALASSGDPHDVILEIGRIGDATSVPFLNSCEYRAKNCRAIRVRRRGLRREALVRRTSSNVWSKRHFASCGAPICQMSWAHFTGLSRTARTCSS